MKLSHFLFLFSLAICHIAYGEDYCVLLKGRWNGDWENAQHAVMAATLTFSSKKPNDFSGEFQLSNGGGGNIAGQCMSINREIYLVLRKDPPYYNPCRGVLIQTEKVLAIHIFLF